jgi:hypothetical protein
MTLIPGLAASGRGLASAGRAVVAGVAEEAVENLYQSPLMDPQNAGQSFSPAQENSYIRRPVDVNDKPAYEAELSRSSNEWNEELGREYEKWNRQERSNDVPYPTSPSRSTLIPMLRR